MVLGEKHGTNYLPYTKLQFWFSEDYLLGVKVMKSSRYSHFINHEIPAATAVIKYLVQ